MSAATPPESPLVPCPRCHARVSDAALVCPACGHPQPPLLAEQRGEDVAACGACGAANPVRNFWSFRSADVCRGCGLSVPEAYPRQVFEFQVDEVHSVFREWRDNLYWGVVVAGVASGGVLAAVGGAALGAGQPLVALAVGGVAGYFGSVPLFAALYFWAVARRWRLPPPNAARAVTAADWGMAGRRSDDSAAAVARQSAERAARAPGSPWGSRLWWAGVALAVGGFAAFQARADYVRREEAVAAREAAVGAAMARDITLAKADGIFSRDLTLTNGSPAAFADCDLTLTAYLDSGKQAPVRQYRAAWGPGETVVVTLPAGGRVERVDVAGTLKAAATGKVGRLDVKFEWKSGKP